MNAYTKFKYNMEEFSKNESNKNNSENRDNLTFEELQKLENMIKLNLLSKYGDSDDEMSLSESTISSDSEYVPGKNTDSDSDSDSRSSSTSSVDEKHKSKSKSKNRKLKSKSKSKSKQERNINDILKIENLKQSKVALEKKIHFMQLELLNKTNDLNETQNKLNNINIFSEHEEKIINFLLSYKNHFNKNLAIYKDITDTEHENQILNDGIKLQNALFKLNQVQENICNINNMIFSEAKFNKILSSYEELIIDDEITSKNKKKVEMFRTLFKQIVRRFSILTVDINNKVNNYNFIIQKNFKTKYDVIILLVAVLIVITAIYLGR